MTRWLLGGLLLLVASFAAAHRFAPSLLQVDAMGGERYSVIWKTPLQSVSPVPLVPVLPADCVVEEASGWVPEGTGKLRQWRLDCSAAGGLVGQSLAVEGLAANQASAMLTVNLADGVSHQQVLTSDSPVFTVPAEPAPGQVVLQYSWLGAEHIWAGIDHLLFVFGLLLLVGQGRRLVYTVTAFTVGHSITLALVTLGVFDYPVALVEFLIALSIFVLALELSRSGRESWLWRRPWWLAGLFGLLHGMGFAGALAETGLPASNVPLALLFFNIGIEIGQLAFIGVLIALGIMLSRLVTITQPGWRLVPIYLLGSLSAMWCIERGLAVAS